MRNSSKAFEHNSSFAARRLAIVLTVFVLLQAFSSRAATQVLTIAYPSGGELFTVGSKQTIRLGPKLKVTSVLLELSRDGGPFQALGPVIPVIKGSAAPLDFAVNGPASGNCVIQATGASKAGNIVVKSDPFTILDLSASGGDYRLRGRRRSGDYQLLMEKLKMGNETRTAL